MAMFSRTRPLGFLVVGLIVLGSGCPKPEEDQPTPPKPADVEPPAPLHTAGPVDNRPPPMAQPVAYWEDGKTDKDVDAATAALHGQLLLDIGEGWTPYLFTDGVDPEGVERPSSYRKIYLELARGGYPKNHHGERAKRDKYLELYGILPTLHVLRERFAKTRELTCLAELDLEPLNHFDGLVVYKTNESAAKQVSEVQYLRSRVNKMVEAQHVEDEQHLDVAQLDDMDRDRLTRYRRMAPEYFAMIAAQQRLKCEGYLEGKGRYLKGGLDWATHEALAEFERRHRIYSWGYLGLDTLAMLRRSPLEAERESVLRVLTERAMQAAGVLEDGSTSTIGDASKPRTYKGADGQQHPIRNLEQELRDRIIAAFGLQTPESTFAWLNTIGELPKGESRLVAIKGVELPEYYDGDMQLTLEYDRGDVWYDFPYNDQGRELPQPVERRPRVTIFTQYNGQRIPIARYGTTIGGWRSEQVGEHVMWKYKGSPPGPRAWSRIVGAPVWLPPDGTPPRDLLRRRDERKPGESKFEVNYHETGPSYASAYGLVAAYHLKFLERADGEIKLGGDEGIRTHGSVDYMSIMRRHSHGCHRLHNHIAVRLMTFVLAHRPHKRIGQQPVAFTKLIEHEGEKFTMEIAEGGYVFELNKPIIVNVLEGRIRGSLQQPIEIPIPKYDEDIGAYVTADGGAIQVRGNQLISVPLPVRPDAGIDGGVVNEIAVPAVPATTKPTAPAPQVKTPLGNPPA